MIELPKLPDKFRVRASPLRLRRSPPSNAAPPAWMLEKCKQHTGRGLHQEDLADLVAALGTLPSDDYEVWYKTLGAIRRDLGESGYDIARDWSAKSEKHTDADFDQKWEEVATLTEIGVGTIFHLARGLAEPEVIPTDGLIVSSDGFIKGFVPPDYLVDGILQRRFLYSLTGPTGTGKTAVLLRFAAHVATGEPLGDLEVEKARVLFLAGENPDDVRMRWIKQCEDMAVEPKDVDVCFLPLVISFRNTAQRKIVEREAKERGPFGLVIVDTSVAYFEGDNENDNVQALAHAKILRGLIELIDGGPTIVVSCHPTKAGENNLPRGGGAFLNEVDGNLVLTRPDPGVLAADLSWQGKFRGPDFAPIPFRLCPGTTDKLVDSKGRPISTVTAEVMSANEREAIEDRTHNEQLSVLALIAEKPGISLAEIATHHDWTYRSGKQEGGPNRSRAQRNVSALMRKGLVKKEGKGTAVTKKGEAALSQRDQEPM